MKPSVLIKATLVALFTAATANAQPQKVQSRTVDQSNEERYVRVTGSHIPQRVKLRSIGTDSAQNVRIYTASELQTTGGQTVAEALRIDPSIQISGH